MIISEKSYQPIHSLTMKAGEDIPAFRFVGYDGNLCSNEGKSLGVSEISWVNGDYMSVITLGTILVESVGTINIGDNVSSDTGGKAKTTSSGMPVNARAISNATAGELVKVILLP